MLRICKFTRKAYISRTVVIDNRPRGAVTRVSSCPVVLRTVNSSEVAHLTCAGRAWKGKRMHVVLVMFRSQGDRRSFSVTRDLTVIGRREDCDFRIPLGEISRKHCRLIKEADTLRIEDLGSSNGTYHNGTRVQEAILQPGDTLQVGSVVFVVQIDGVPADDELQPVPRASTRRLPADEEAATEATTSADDNGEFDPMTVLDSNDSAIPQESMAIDLEGSHIEEEEKE